jgi:hypothetical protein
MDFRRRNQYVSINWLVLIVAILLTEKRLSVCAAEPPQRHQERALFPRRLLRSENEPRILSNILKKPVDENDFRGPDLVKSDAEAAYNLLSLSFQVNGIGAEQYAYCYVLLGSVAVDGKVCYSQYCEFLKLMSNGEISDCKHLDSFWVQLFYNTACGNKQHCDHDSAHISLKEEGVNLWGLHQLCEEAMSNTFTRTTLSFEFSIQYNSSRLDKGEIADCVSNATENLLYDSFGCVAAGRRQLPVIKSSTEHKDYQAKKPADSMPERERGHGHNDFPGRRAFLRQHPFGPPEEWTRENCPYSVTTQVIVSDLGTTS